MKKKSNLFNRRLVLIHSLLTLLLLHFELKADHFGRAIKLQIGKTLFICGLYDVSFDGIASTNTNPQFSTNQNLLIQETILS